MHLSGLGQLTGNTVSIVLGMNDFRCSIIWRDTEGGRYQAMPRAVVRIVAVLERMMLIHGMNQRWKVPVQSGITDSHQVGQTDQVYPFRCLHHHLSSGQRSARVATCAIETRGPDHPRVELGTC